MKKLLALALVLVLICSALPVFAEETPAADTVEIQFCVGDSNLLINGKEVAVETPYVVGDGVTLVPLRVITEAFGAEVGWIAETQTITLKYPGVEIVLQIGNPIAEVNGVAETLLAAPELPNSSTMVPLRFISETFGATVGYDEATEKITVTKTTTTGETVLDSAINNAKIGDSFWGWSMDNPKDFVMEDRSFDGIFTSFSYDEENFFYLAFDIKPEDFSFEKTFNSLKESLSDMTLVKADKDTSNTDLQSMHFQAKDKKEFLNSYIYVNDSNVIILEGNFSIENTEIREKALKYMESFALDFAGDDIYDLSNVKDGYRTFKDEQLKISFNVPEDMLILSEEDGVNRYEFTTYGTDTNRPGIILQVVSKSEVKSAFDLANTDFARNKLHLNEEIVEFSQGVYEKPYGGLTAYEYSYTCSTKKNPFTSKDVFFEMGEYVYNMSLDYPKDGENAAAFFNNILNSVKIEEANAEEIGIILRNYNDTNETYTETCDGYTLELPVKYTEISENMYIDGSSGIGFTVFVESKKLGNKNAVYTETVQTYRNVNINPYKAKSKSEVLEIGGKFVGNFVLYKDDDNGRTYYSYYVISQGNQTYTFLFISEELAFSAYARNVMEKIVTSVQTKK